MYRSEALQNLYQAQDAVRFAQQSLDYAQELLAESECDHPDTNGLQCAHCGVFYISPETLELDDNYRVFVADRDDLRSKGFPPPPMYSEYVF